MLRVSLKASRPAAPLTAASLPCSPTPKILQADTKPQSIFALFFFFFSAVRCNRSRDPATSVYEFIGCQRHVATGTRHEPRTKETRKKRVLFFFFFFRQQHVHNRNPRFSFPSSSSSSSFFTTGTAERSSRSAWSPRCPWCTRRARCRGMQEARCCRARSGRHPPPGRASRCCGRRCPRTGR